MPALQTAKKQAQAIVCLANMRGLSNSWYLYAEDNDSKVCGSHTPVDPLAAVNFYEGSDKSYAAFCWPQTEAGNSAGGGTEEEELNGIRRGLLYPYYEGEKLTHCPGDRRYKDPGELDPSCDGGYRSFAFVGGMRGEDGGWAGYTTLMSFSQLKNPSDKYILVEETDGRGFNMNSWCINPDTNDPSWIDCLAIWHNKRGNLGFSDGHGEKHRWVDERTIQMAEDQINSISSPGNEDMLYMKRYFPYDKLL
jgi:hypothetical protein